MPEYDDGFRGVRKRTPRNPESGLPNPDELLRRENDADNEREERDTFDKCGRDDHCRTQCTGHLGLTSERLERRTGKAANAETCAKHGECCTEAGAEVS
jgi:hypothetical protein